MVLVLVLIVLWLLVPATVKACSRYIITRTSQDVLIIADKGLDALESATNVSQKDWDTLVKKAQK